MSEKNSPVYRGNTISFVGRGEKFILVVGNRMHCETRSIADSGSYGTRDEKVYGLMRNK